MKNSSTKSKSWPPHVRESMIRIATILICGVVCWLVLYGIRVTVFHGPQDPHTMHVFEMIAKLVVALVMAGISMNFINDAHRGFVIVSAGASISIIYRDKSPFLFYLFSSINSMVFLLELSS